MGDITQSETASRFKTSTPEDFGPDSSGMFTSERDSQQTDAELTYNSNNHGSGAASYGSNIFSSAHHFSVSGGTFTNITHNHNTVSTALPDFRQIPLGDIDLRELRLERTSNCFVRQRQSTCRVYAARVEGRRSRVTVAIYEGDGAKEDWQEHISFYSSLRHPNFVQLWGVTTSSRIHAAIFHDELIPFRHFLDLHRPVLVVYIYAYVAVEYWNSVDYFDSDCFDSVFEGSSLYHHQCSLWIRLSTGQLCLDPAIEAKNPEYFKFPEHDVDMNSNPPALLSLKAPGTESMAVDCLELDQYHWTCVKSLASRCVVLPPASGTTNLASLIYRPSGSQSQQSVQLASIPKLETCLDDCSDSDIYGVVMQNGWVRYHFHEGLPVLPALFWFGSWNGFNEQDCESWLSQANHIFSRLQITTHLEDYGVVTEVEYRIHIPPKDLPAGYLFLCPTADFKTGPSSFRWPECPAYWSLDATGIERLSTEEANRLGFPSIQLETLIFLASWDAGVYAGLRQFHQAKGFDPDSQNVARHLGHQLFQFTSEMEASFTSVTAVCADFWADDDDWNLGFTDPGSVGCNDIEPSAKEESQLTKIVQDESPVRETKVEAEELYEEPQAVSLAFNFIIGLQLALILLAWLCAAMFNGVSE